MYAYQTKDSRSHHRESLVVNVEVHSVVGSERQEINNFITHVRDISVTGMCIYTDVPYPKDTRLELSVEMAGSVRQYKLTGQVIWSSFERGEGKFRTGIHLIKLPEDRAAWQSAVIQSLIGLS